MDVQPLLFRLHICNSQTGYCCRYGSLCKYVLCGNARKSDGNVCIVVSEEVDWSWFPRLRNSDKHSQNDDVSRLMQLLVEKPGDRGLLPRRKRNVLLSSGVRLCSQETVQQVISNHLKYYQLRGESLLQYCYVYNVGITYL